MTMKTSAVILAFSAMAAAQVTYNNDTNQYDCAKPNANFCAGASLKTDIIIRCNSESVGVPGRCTDNLAGQPPLGVNPAFCWQSSENAGDAACEKECTLYPEQAGAKPSTIPQDQCSQEAGGANTTTAASAPFVTGSPAPTEGEAGAGGVGGVGGGGHGGANTTAAAPGNTTTTEAVPTVTTTHTGGQGGGAGGAGGTQGTTGATGTETEAGGTGTSPTATETGAGGQATGAAVHNEVGALAVVGLMIAYFF